MDLVAPMLDDEEEEEEEEDEEGDGIIVSQQMIAAPLAPQEVSRGLSLFDLPDLEKDEETQAWWMTKEEEDEEEEDGPEVEAFPETHEIDKKQAPSTFVLRMGPLPKEFSQV